MSEVALLGIFQGFAFLVGLALGSFANVAIDRMPMDRSLLPRSRCDTCGTAIRPTDNIPSSPGSSCGDAAGTAARPSASTCR